MENQQPKVQGVQTETTDDGILIVRINNVHRETVNAFCDLLHNFDVEGSILHRHNRSMVVLSGNAYPTPYATQRLIAVAKGTPADLLESQAVVIGDNIVARLVKMMINKLDSKAQQSLRVFFTEQDALTWLKDREHLITEQRKQQSHA